MNESVTQLGNRRWRLPFLLGLIAGLAGVAHERNWLLFVLFRMNAGLVGLDVDATASGRLSWLERGGHRLKPIRKPGGLSSNRALF